MLVCKGPFKYYVMTLGEVVGGEAKVLQLIKINKLRLHCAVINYIDWGRVFVSNVLSSLYPLYVHAI